MLGSLVVSQGRGTCSSTVHNVTPICLCYQACIPTKWRWCLMAGKVSVDPATRWLCITYLGDSSSYVLKASVWEMSTPPYAPLK